MHMLILQEVASTISAFVVMTKLLKGFKFLFIYIVELVGFSEDNMSQPPYPTAPGAPYPRYVVHQLLHIVWLKSRVGLDLDFCLPRDQDLPVQHRQGSSVFSSLLCCLVSTVESVDDPHILILNSGIFQTVSSGENPKFPRGEMN